MITFSEIKPGQMLAVTKPGQAPFFLPGDLWQAVTPIRRGAELRGVKAKNHAGQTHDFTDDEGAALLELATEKGKPLADFPKGYAEGKAEEAVKAATPAPVTVAASEAAIALAVEKSITLFVNDQLPEIIEERVTAAVEKALKK